MSPVVSMDAEVAKPTGDHLEHGKTSKKGILLRPQPTNDPNEPLVCSAPSSAAVPMMSDPSTELASMGEILHVPGDMLVCILGIHELVGLYSCDRADHHAV